MTEIVALVVLAAWLSGFDVISHKAVGVAALPSAAPDGTPRCETTEGDPCRAAARDQVSAFQQGALRDSRGYRFSLGLRTRLDVYCVTQVAGCPSGRRDDDGGKWWRAPLSGAYCIPYAGFRFCGGDSIPQKDREAFNRVMVGTDLVALKCGIAAAIGYTGLKGGGAWWGAGKGAGVCLWMTVFNAIFNFRLLQATNIRGADDTDLARTVLTNLPAYPTSWGLPHLRW